MKNKMAAILFTTILFITFSGLCVQANEMQRLFYEFAGNMGNAVTVLELQGITQANVNDFNAALQRADNALTTIINNYQDPPFDRQMIVNCQQRLRGFNQAAQRMNANQQVAYLNNIYNNFKQAMSYTFDSRYGLQYCATCDTFVVDLGFFLGRARIAGVMRADSVYSGAVSRVNLAVSEGINAVNNLGCAFFSWVQWQSTGWRNVNSPQAMDNVIITTAGLIASARGIGGAPSMTPSSPPRGNTPPNPGNSLAGSWRFGNGARVEFSAAGNTIVGYLYDLNDHLRRQNFEEGEAVYEVTSSSANNFTGRVKFKAQYGEVQWTNCQITINGDTATVISYDPDDRQTTTTTLTRIR